MKNFWKRFRAWAAAVVAAVVAAVGLLLGLPVETQQTVDSLTRTNPTTRTDGSALTNLASIRIQWGTTLGGPYNDGQEVVSATVAQPYEIQRSSTPGTRCYVAIAVDSNGLESAPSNEACKTITAPPDSIVDLSVS